MTENDRAKIAEAIAYMRRQRRAMYGPTTADLAFLSAMKITWDSPESFYSPTSSTK